MAKDSHVSEVWALMTRVTSSNDFADQILADQEAMSRMQDEGGTSETVEVLPTIKKPVPKTTVPAQQDSSPIIALFRDPGSADAALKELRAFGIENESIGVAYSNEVILSPANDPNTYRATGKAPDGHEFEDPILPDSFRAPSHRRTPATPNSSGYDGSFEADQYHNPQHHVMVSVQVESDQRQPVRDLLISAGAAS
jgi:hypothetical protein